MPRRSTKGARERTPLSGDYDAIVCGASFAGLATGAGADRRPGAAARPLRRRRAPDLGLRRAHRMAGGARAWSARFARRSTGWCSTRRTGPCGSRCPGRSRPSTTRRCASCWTPRTTREFETAKVEGRGGRGARARRGQHRPRRGDAPRSSWTRSAGAGCSARTATSLPTPRSHAAWRYIPADPAGSSRSGSTARSCRPVTAGASRRRRGARRRGLLRPAVPREGADGRPRGAAAARRGALPGQLDPAPAAPRRRGRHLLHGRLRGPLPAADRRGHPHRVLLRDRARAGAAPGDRGPRVARLLHCAVMRRSPPRTRGNSRWMLRAQRFVPKVPPRALALATRGMASRRFTHWAFDHYLEIAQPDRPRCRPARSPAQPPDVCARPHRGHPPCEQQWRSR